MIRPASRTQRLAAALNHLAWAALALCFLAGLVAYVSGFDDWDTAIGSALNGLAAALFLLAFLASFVACGLAVVRPTQISTPTKRESVLTVVFIALIVGILVFAPSFIAGLARSPSRR